MTCVKGIRIVDGSRLTVNSQQSTKTTTEVCSEIQYDFYIDIIFLFSRRENVSLPMLEFVQAESGYSEFYLA